MKIVCVGGGILQAPHISLMIYFPSSFLSFRRYFQDLCIWLDFRELYGGREVHSIYRESCIRVIESIYFALCLNLFLLWTFLSNGSFFTLSNLSPLFIRTLIIKLFQSRHRRKCAKCIRKVCQLFFKPSGMLRKYCIHQCLQNCIFNDAKVKLTSPFWCTDV